MSAPGIGGMSVEDLQAFVWEKWRFDKHAS
jgi:hypothetical protein